MNENNKNTLGLKIQALKGWHSIVVSKFALRPSCPGFDSRYSPNEFEGNFIIGEINQVNREA